jgi:hypothetical protein
MLEKAFPANIKLLETFLAADPGNPDTLLLLARFYATYGFVFFEGRLDAAMIRRHPSDPLKADTTGIDYSRLKETADRCYQKGAAYALRALEVHHGKSRERLMNVSTRDAFFKAVTRQDVPALFWYGFNLGGYINLNRNSVRAISMANLAEKAMKRVIELEPGFYHGGAHLFLLSYYASRPSALGGNLKASLSHYNQIKKITKEEYLLPDLYFARYYLYQTQNRKKFEALLTKIVQYPGTESEFRMRNTVAATRAKTYLESIDHLFQKNN